MNAPRLLATACVAASLALTLPATVATGAADADTTSYPVAPAPTTIDHAGRWIIDGQGRVLVTHGMNMVNKYAPYTPAAVGFDDDDAAFLHEQGLDSIRLGISWTAVEPQPGVYDDTYLASIEHTVRMLAAHGVTSLIDMHQDQYNPRFEGNGMPDWAVIDDGLPAAPKVGFGADYLLMPALNRAYDHFWANAKAPDGIGLQDHYAAAWAHVAARFAGVPGVLGYDLLNEPWPGSLYATCLPLGCPLLDQKLAAFDSRVRDAIRARDARHMIWYEPYALFNDGVQTTLGPLRSRLGVKDAHAGMSFHDYCLSADYGSTLGCDLFDNLVFANAERHSTKTGAGLLLTEFGATDDLTALTTMLDRADRDRVGWMHWTYAGNADPTTSAGSGAVQAVVLDAAQPPTGDNVKQAKLTTLAVAHPAAVAGTPQSWSFDHTTRVFRFTYSATRVQGQGTFPTGSITTIAAPQVQYPDGYRVTVTGAHVLSAPGDPVLRLASTTTGTVSVEVAPR